MANKKLVLGMSGVVLAFALLLGGCALDSGDISDDIKVNDQGSVSLLSLDSIVPAPAVGKEPKATIDTDAYSG